MAKTLLIVAIAMMAMCDIQCLQRVRTIRFPGPEHHTQRLRFPARQQAAPAPYPAAGSNPEPPFELPTEEATYFPEPTYGPPEQTYGPPDQTYGPPEETYGPPEETYGPPEETYGPPDQTYGPPDQTSELPAQIFIESAIETLDPREFYPKTKLTPPHSERLLDFRSSPKLQKQVSVRIARRPVQTSAKLIRPNFIEMPKTSLTLPLVERLTAFRSFPRRQPSISATLRRPQLRKRPSKIQASLKHTSSRQSIQQSFAQLQPIKSFPIHFADGTTIYSDQLQSWSK